MVIAVLVMPLVSLPLSSLGSGDSFATSRRSPFSVAEALKSAYENRPDFKKTHFDIRALERSQRVALADYLPHISFKAGAGTASPLSFFAPKRFAQIEFSQLLYNPAGPIQRFRIARQDTRVAQWQRKILEYNIRVNVERDVLDLWYSQQRRWLILDYYIVSKMVYSQDVHEFNLGLSNLSAFLQKRSDFASAQSRARQYLEEIRVSSENLERSAAITISPLTPIDKQSVNDLIAEALRSAVTHTAPEYFQEAVLNRRELDAIDETITKESYWQKFYCKSYFPKIALYTMLVKYTYKGNIAATIEASVATGWNTGLSISWQFDGLANVFNASAADERAFAAMMERIDMIAKIKKDVFINHAELRKFFKDYVSAIIDYRRASNEIKLKRKQYEVGLLSLVEKRQADVVWYKASYDFLTTKINVAKQYRTLLHSCGYPEALPTTAHRRV